MIQIQFNAKTVTYFTSDYSDYSDYQDEKVLNRLGWRLQKEYRPDLPDGAYSDDRMAEINAAFLQHAKNKPNWIMRVVYATPLGDERTLLGPLSHAKDPQGFGRIPNPRPQEPSWVPGEEEEEPLLYRST